MTTSKGAQTRTTGEQRRSAAGDFRTVQSPSEWMPACTAEAEFAGEGVEANLPRPCICHTTTKAGRKRASIPASPGCGGVKVIPYYECVSAQNTHLQELQSTCNASDVNARRPVPLQQRRMRCPKVFTAVSRWDRKRKNQGNGAFPQSKGRNAMSGPFEQPPCQQGAPFCSSHASGSSLDQPFVLCSLGSGCSSPDAKV